MISLIKIKFLGDLKKVLFSLLGPFEVESNMIFVVLKMLLIVPL